MEKWDVVGVKGCGCVGEGGGLPEQGDCEQVAGSEGGKTGNGVLVILLRHHLLVGASVLLNVHRVACSSQVGGK